MHDVVAERRKKKVERQNPVHAVAERSECLIREYIYRYHQEKKTEHMYTDDVRTHLRT